MGNQIRGANTRLLGANGGPFEGQGIDFNIRMVCGAKLDAPQR
jgi:hypothetical protein